MYVRELMSGCNSTQSLESELKGDLRSWDQEVPDLKPEACSALCSMVKLKRGAKFAALVVRIGRSRTDLQNYGDTYVKLETCYAI